MVAIEMKKGKHGPMQVNPELHTVLVLGYTHRLWLSWKPGGESWTHMNSRVTHGMYWASRRTQTASGCLRSDLS